MSGTFPSTPTTQSVSIRLQQNTIVSTTASTPTALTVASTNGYIL